MPMRPYNLPSVNALLAFEVAARHGSFKHAARELNVTPAAVSHQIKALEEDLSQHLFDRHYRGVALTNAGVMLKAALQHGFEHIADAVEQVRWLGEDVSVTIAATTAMSSLWLTPRLSLFWREYGHIAVNQLVSDRPHRHQHADLVLRYGDMQKDSGDCKVLFKDSILPLASPDFAAIHQPQTLAELSYLPLIHLNVAEANWTSWKSWFEAQGGPTPRSDAMKVNNYAIALQVAQDGIGVVLGWKSLTARLLKEKKLVPLMDLALPAPLDFYIKMRPGASSRSQLLRDWLISDLPA